MQIKT